jgi:hypothetical protein
MTELRAQVADAKSAMDAHDAQTLASLFAPDGRVADDNEEHVGRPAIERWFAATPLIRLETVSSTVDGNAHALVAKGYGDYPQSPLTFRYDFTLSEAGIDSLSISLAT